MNENGKTVEFRLVNDEELPPVVITMKGSNQWLSQDMVVATSQDYRWMWTTTVR